MNHKQIIARTRIRLDLCLKFLFLSQCISKVIILWHLEWVFLYPILIRLLNIELSIGISLKIIVLKLTFMVQCILISFVVVTLLEMVITISFVLLLSFCLLACLVLFDELVTIHNDIKICLNKSFMIIWSEVDALLLVNFLTSDKREILISFKWEQIIVFSGRFYCHSYSYTIRKLIETDGFFW